MAESSLQPSMRRGDANDMPAVLALLQSAGLPTADPLSAQRLQLWVLQSDSLQGVIALEHFGSEAFFRALDYLDYPIDGLRSKVGDEFATSGSPHVDFIMTVCDNAAGETCPVWLGKPTTARRGIPDPAP